MIPDTSGMALQSLVSKMIPAAAPHFHFFKAERVTWTLRFYRCSDNIRNVTMLLLLR